MKKLARANIAIKSAAKRQPESLVVTPSTKDLRIVNRVDSEVLGLDWEVTPLDC